MSQYSVHYYKCPKCGSIKYKKRGRPKDKIYECLKCGALHFKGIRVATK